MLTLPNILEIITLSQLRYKTSKLLKKLVEEEEPVLLVKRAKQIGVILPIKTYQSLIKKKKKKAINLKKIKIKSFPLGIAPEETRRTTIYHHVGL